MDKSANARNDKILGILNNYFENANDPVFEKPFDSGEVNILFTTPVWGHRELVLTILLTRLIYPEYKATENLYQHHPRSVYEKPIRTSFRKFGIPHKKSGPLNVAKNIKRLNMDWATDKNDEKVAVSAVKIVEKIEAVSVAELKRFAQAYISRYKQEALRVKDLEVDLPAQENPIYIAELCVDLINNVPDGGATAQFIIGALMEMTNEARGNEVTVAGHLDSVSATNTTSKKPGDIIETIADTGDEIVYEITTKAFNDDRMRESHEAITDYGKKIADVFVICRAADVPDSLEISATSYLMATTQFKELSYYFVNIYQYIQGALLFVTTDDRSDFYDELVEYINDINRSEKVKLFFSEWHKKKAQRPSSSKASWSAEPTA